MNTAIFQDALILTGPTGSGKTALALELAGKLNAEIIAMDSMTLYRGMDIGTAKPSPAERAQIRHHLIDVLDPWESGNIAWWLEQAAQCCQEIQSRGKKVLFVGGTPFYLKALLHGLFESPPVDPEIRQRLEQEAQELGGAILHERLAQVDPVAAKSLHPNDIRRVVRALEVWEMTGKPLSALQQQNWFQQEQPSEENALRFEAHRCLCLDLPRNILYERINQRVEKMIEAGWIAEVEYLRKTLPPWSKEASKALGYPEIGDYLDGKTSFAETLNLIQTHSRQYARRQLTWFRHLAGCELCEGHLTFGLWAGKMV